MNESRMTGLEREEGYGSLILALLQQSRNGPCCFSHVMHFSAGVTSHKSNPAGTDDKVRSCQAV